MAPDIRRIEAIPVPVDALNAMPQRQGTRNIRAQEIAVSKHCGALFIRKELREPWPEVPWFQLLGRRQRDPEAYARKGAGLGMPQKEPDFSGTKETAQINVNAIITI